VPFEMNFLLKHVQNLASTIEPYKICRRIIFLQKHDLPECLTLIAKIEENTNAYRFINLKETKIFLDHGLQMTLLISVASKNTWT